MSRGPGSRYITSGWPSVRHLCQTNSYLNGVFAVNLPQGNRNVSIALTVEHQFNNESECFLFIVRLGMDCPTYGSLEMGVRGVNGGKIVFPGTVITDVRPFGASVTSVTLTYQIQLGRPANPKVA